MASCAIMQPYLFPYLGYWQLINLVDNFVIYDDVNFQTKGFINRNYFNLNGKPYKLTLPLIKPSQNKLINEIEIGPRKKFLKTIQRLLIFLQDFFSKLLIFFKYSSSFWH